MIKKGSKGEEVKKWQEFLSKLGYDLAIDGDFGADTHDYTVAFQNLSDIGADGIVGKGTYKEAIARGYEGGITA